MSGVFCYRMLLLCLKGFLWLRCLCICCCHANSCKIFAVCLVDAFTVFCTWNTRECRYVEVWITTCYNSLLSYKRRIWAMNEDSELQIPASSYEWRFCKYQRNDVIILCFQAPYFCSNCLHWLLRSEEYNVKFSWSHWIHCRCYM